MKVDFHFDVKVLVQSIIGGAGWGMAFCGLSSLLVPTMKVTTSLTNGFAAAGAALMVFLYITGIMKV